MALKLKGSTSGFVGLDAPAVAGNNTLILPENAGSAQQLLGNDITAGVVTFTSVTVNRNGDLTVPGTISIGGTLTYEDVTSVDSVGIVTARSGVRINGGGLTIIGDTTGLKATGISTFVDVSARNITGVAATFTGAISGTTGTFTGDIDIASSLVHTGDTDTKLTFTTDNISLITGGTTRVNVTSAGNLELPNDNDYLKIGAGGDLSFVHTGSASYITNSTGFLQLQSGTIRFDNASGTEYGRFDSAGRLNIGPAAAVSQTRNLNVGSNSEANLAIETHNDAASESANIRFYKSRGTAGSPTAVADNHYIGQLIFYGQDGTDYANTAAYMRVQVDGTVASNQIPGEMEFGINDGSSATRAMTIHKTGNVLFSGLTAKNDGRNAKGISLKNASGGAGISFETFGSNGSRNWRIRQDDITSWGSLDFSVSPTANDATDWPDEAGDVVMSLESGNVKLTNSDLVMGSGKGISFAATANSSGTTSSELLDDYEEGTFSPTITASAYNPTMSYTQQSGKYTKIGNLVYITLDLRWSGRSGGGGNARLSNLPFTSTTSQPYSGGIVFEKLALTSHADEAIISLEVGSNASYGTFLSTVHDDGGSSSGLVIGNFQNTSGYLMISFNYFTD